MTSDVLQGAIFLPGNRVTEHPSNGDEPGKFLFEVVPGKMNRETSGVQSLQEFERERECSCIRWNDAEITELNMFLVKNQTVGNELKVDSDVYILECLKALLIFIALKACSRLAYELNQICYDRKTLKRLVQED